MFPRISPIVTNTASVLVGTYSLLCGYERPVKVCKGIVKDCPSFAHKFDRQRRPERAAEAGVLGVGAGPLQAASPRGGKHMALTAKEFEVLAAQWRETKNGDLTSDQVTAGSGEIGLVAMF